MEIVCGGSVSLPRRLLPSGSGSNRDVLSGLHLCSGHTARL